MFSPQPFNHSFIVASKVSENQKGAGGTFSFLPSSMAGPRFYVAFYS